MYLWTLILKKGGISCVCLRFVHLFNNLSWYFKEGGNFKSQGKP
jgi:hypothetical protein